MVYIFNYYFKCTCTFKPKGYLGIELWDHNDNAFMNLDKQIMHMIQNRKQCMHPYSYTGIDYFSYKLIVIH